MSFAATSVALERLEGFRLRLSRMDPHDGPVSAYKAALQELYDAEVDYNYCLYFPADEAFQPPPLLNAPELIPKQEESKEYRFRMRSLVEQCMRKGTLQGLKDGEIQASSAECLGQPSLAKKSFFEPSDGLEQSDIQRDLQLSSIMDPKQIQMLGQSIPS